MKRTKVEKLHAILAYRMREKQNAKITFPGGVFFSRKKGGFLIALFVQHSLLVLFDLVDPVTLRISDPFGSTRKVGARNHLETLPKIFLSGGEAKSLESLAIPK